MFRRRLRGTEGVLYSNNPNSNRALFRVTVDDQNTPLRSKFIKLDGGGRAPDSKVSSPMITCDSVSSYLTDCSSKLNSKTLRLRYTLTFSCR